MHKYSSYYVRQTKKSSNTIIDIDMMTQNSIEKWDNTHDSSVNTASYCPNWMIIVSVESQNLWLFCDICYGAKQTSLFLENAANDAEILYILIKLADYYFDIMWHTNIQVIM